MHNGYVIGNYQTYTDFEKVCILRHDIDVDIAKAVKFAEIEHAMDGVQASYFVLLNTSFYNAFEARNIKGIKKIANLGHLVGLHFDETQYVWGKNINCLTEYILKEVNLLEQIIEIPVNIISMHRPSKFLLESNLCVPGIINTYSALFFKDFKYLSDSMHTWREDAEKIIIDGKFKRIHILTHPFWYTDQPETMRDKVYNFIINGNLQLYNELHKSVLPNINNLIKQEEIEI
ncbi:MAG: hypothetical protein LBR10_15270 [Prevotellaceae bacterium]|nr:hypothetical protein [Prevotellaceae bacterium]